MFWLMMGILVLTLGCDQRFKSDPDVGRPIGVSQQLFTAGDVIHRVKENLTCPWDSKTVDTFKSGSESTKITGIATTFLATMEVLKKAEKAGLNLIITHEPTFYNHLDDTTFFEGDVVYNEKRDFLHKHDMAVFRFHDHWHRTMPDGIYKGMVEQLGWENFEKNSEAHVYKLPRKTIGDVARFLKEKYDSKSIRVVGDPKMQVTDVGLALGAPGFHAQINLLRRDDVQLLITGETHEWETVEWVRDAVSEGKRKGLILMGHANSEEAGMKYCADWLSEFVTEVPIQFIAAGDPFWVPE